MSTCADTLWNESRPVTAWAGITFGEAGGADAGRVVAIDRNRPRGTGLTGDVPAELGRLTALKSLKLGSNQLTSVPAELGRAVQVDSITSRIPIAYGVRNQRLKLEYHKPVLPFAFNFNLRR